MSNLNKIIVIGDRVLIKPDAGNDKTKSGLYLPPTVSEKEEVSAGYIIKTGPGYPVPDLKSPDDEPWSLPKSELKYVPLQAKPGDLAIFLRKSAIEIEFEEEKYIIVPQAAILVLVREDFLNE